MLDELRSIADCPLSELRTGQHLPRKVCRRQVTVHICRLHLLLKRPLLVLLAQLDVLRYLVNIQVSSNSPLSYFYFAVFTKALKFRAFSLLTPFNFPCGYEQRIWTEYFEQTRHRWKGKRAKAISVLLSLCLWDSDSLRDFGLYLRDQWACARSLPATDRRQQMLGEGVARAGLRLHSDSHSVAAQHNVLLDHGL